MNDKSSVLFVCVHNAGRSQMAAAYLEHLGGCGDTCPFFPGKRYEDWVLDDPAGQGIEAVRPIRDEIRVRVETLLRGLGVEPVA